MKLHLSSDFSIPDRAQVETFAILAKRGAGKTYTASVMAEEMGKAGLPFVVVDPVGVWWGLRASSSGKGPGLPIYVLGGEHADIPLQPTAGELVAETIVKNRISCVLDLSLFRKGETVRFMTSFFETLYLRNREALHVFIDEADAFAPQKPPPGPPLQLLGAVEDIVRRGRARGLGVTLITQRAAVLNKDVLTQIEVLVVLRTIGLHDRKAIEAWIDCHGSDEEKKELFESLASLGIGEAWFWSPAWLKLFKKVQIRKRETFDSSATPEAGARKIEPAKLATVDLGALEEAMKATVEEVKANDPKKLRDLISVLQKENQKLSRTVIQEKKLTAPAPKIVEVVGDKMALTIAGAAHDMAKAAKELSSKSEEILQALKRAHPGPVKLVSGPPMTLKIDPKEMVVVRRPWEDDRPAPKLVSPKELEGGSSVTPARQKILGSLLFLDSIGISEAESVQLALLSDASPSSSSFTGNLGYLKGCGFIHYPSPGRVELTEAGKTYATDGEQLPILRTSEAIHTMLRNKLPDSKFRMLKTLIDAHPSSIRKDELAEKVESSITSSTFTGNMGSLRALGLIEYTSGGEVRARDLLFV